jgi:hypothetical protein
MFRVIIRAIIRAIIRGSDDDRSIPQLEAIGDHVR